MAAITELESRLDAEFSKLQKSVSEFQKSHLQEYEEREARFAGQFAPAVETLKEIWRPRLEALVERFKDQVKAQPVMTPHSRQAKLEFESPLARVVLRFSAGHDTEVRNLVLVYDLEILPVYMEFEKHAELSMPLAAIDEGAVAKWLDDRIVGFVRTYLALQTNEYYLKDHLVETYFFIGDATCEQFRREKGITS